MKKITNYCDKCGATTDKVAQIRINLNGYVKIPLMVQSQARYQNTCNGVDWLQADLCPRCAAEIAGLFFEEPDTVTVNE